MQTQPKPFRLKPIQFFRPTGSNGEADFSDAHPFVDEHESHPAGSVHFVTFSFQDSGIFDEACFKNFIDQLPWECFRIKGTVRFADRLKMLNFVGGKREWSPWEGEAETRLTFIGWKIDKQQTLKDLKRCLA